MNQACRRCLGATVTATLRTTSRLPNHNHSPATSRLHNHPTTWSAMRTLHTTTITTAKKARTGMDHLYKDGKRIVEEVDDRTSLAHVLLLFKSYDEPSLDGGFEFAKKAAKMTKISVTKSFRMPAKEHLYQSVVSDESENKKTLEYRLKVYERCISLENVKADEIDVYLSMVYQSLPPGVNVDVMLKRWEEYADPNNPLLRKDHKTATKELMKKALQG